MANHPLVEYIQKARHRGMTNEQILEALTDAGWRLHDVVSIVLDHANNFPLAEDSAISSAKNENIISVRNISKSYGVVRALDNVSLDIKSQSVTALLGPNGAGKTTLIRILTTLLAPDSGSAHVAGFDVVNDAEKLRSIIGLAGQYAAVDEVLTGRENLEMVARLYHLNADTAKSRASELLKQFDLEDAADRTVGTYSGGMRRRLDLAASIVIRPKILFLDEPTAGLDPRSRFELWHIIRDLVRGGTTVLLTTQYLEEADQLANHIFVIDHGHIIAEGPADELKRKVGGDVLELHVSNHQDAPKAAEAIRKFGKEAPHIDADTGIVTLPVAGDAAILVDVVRELDGADLKLHDIRLRRPSLDDVFLKLTGHVAE